jgi:hypothetical protein
MFFRNLHQHHSPGTYLHEPSEIDSTKLFQFLDFINNFIQFFANPSLNPRIQRRVLWISLNFTLQFTRFILQLLTDIMLEGIYLQSTTSRFVYLL